MAKNPWDEINSDAVLFIIDAVNHVEQECLTDWLAKAREESKNSNFQGAIYQVVLPIAGNSGKVPSAKLENLLAQDLPLSTLLMPVRIVWRSSLDRSDSKPRLRDLLLGNPRRPGARKAKRILEADSSQAQCVAATPATLEQLQERYADRQKNALIDASLADFIADQASLALYVAERRLRGVRYKAPRQVAKQIRASDRYNADIEALAKEIGEPELKLRERALPIFKELVAVPHNFWQDVMVSINRWIVGMGYENEIVFDQERMERFRQVVKDNPTVLLWTHKTHVDGLALQIMFFDNDFPTPHTMGGINMAFAGLGFLARRSGAVFIQRSFQDNPLYKLVFRNYLAYLLEKRVPLSWAFEGTRSRTGKLMPPRYGMFKYVLDAMAGSDADQLHIIPVAINYDMINDVKDYAAEQSGGIKRPESLSWFISYVKRLKQPLGRVYIDFGEPVVVDKNAISDDSLAIAKIAFKVGVEVNQVTPITLTSLMSMSLLGSAPRAQTLNELRESVRALYVWAQQRGICCSSDFDAGNIDHTQKLINDMVQAKLITCYFEGPETIYGVAEDQHVAASYYRNTIAHYFVAKSIAELALAHTEHVTQNTLDEFWAEAERLRDMFKFEFFYSPTNEFKDQVRAELNLFDKDWEQKIAATPSYAKTLLASMEPLVAHSVLKIFIESYRIIADVYAGLDDGQTIENKAAVSMAMKYARQAYLQRRISSQASIGTLLFGNAIKLLDSYGLVTPSQDQDLADFQLKRKKLSKNFRLLSRRLEHIRNLALPKEID